jgi:acyl-coenzyme A thioesterase PaaI-like protein
MVQIDRLWQRATTLPLVGERFGKKVFSMAFSQVAPYFSSIGATVTVLEPNRAELVIRDRRKVHNHIGTVHAIALCNGLEMAMGALAEVTVPATKRWIPKGMTVSYTAKAAGNVTCVAETTQAQWDEAEGDLPVHVWGFLADGTVVIDGTINLWVTTKKPRA